MENSPGIGQIVLSSGCASIGVGYATGGKDSGVCSSSKADCLYLCSLCSTDDVSMTYFVTLVPDLT